MKTATTTLALALGLLVGAMQFTVGGRYYADGPSGGPDWGMRAVLTFLFPKG